MGLPLPQALTQALHYLRVLLSSTYADSWRRLKSIILTLNDHDLPIAPRWRRILDPDWGTLPDKPCPLILARVTRQPTIVEAFRHTPPPQPHKTGDTTPRLEMHFRTRGKQWPSKRGPANKRKVPQTIAPLRGSDAPKGSASIQKILVRSNPRRIKHNRRSTYVEEFLVQWGPEQCTLAEALEQYSMGLNIASITSLDDKVPSTDLQPFVSVKRMTTQQHQKHKTPPLDTNCIV